MLPKWVKTGGEDSSPSSSLPSWINTEQPEEKVRLGRGVDTRTLEYTPLPKRDKNYDYNVKENVINNNIAKPVKPLPTVDKGGVFGVKAWENFKNTHKDTPGILKPLGYILETPYRIPFLDRTLTTGGETIAGKGSMVDTEGKARVKPNLGGIGNFVADSAGTMLGLGQNLGGASPLKATDVLGEKASQFVAKKLPQASNLLANSTTEAISNRALQSSKYILPSMVRGAVDVGVGNAMQTGVQGGNIKETLQSGGEGALQGAAMFGGGKLLKDSLPLFKGLKKTPQEIIPQNNPNILNPRGVLKQSEAIAPLKINEPIKSVLEPKFIVNNSKGILKPNIVNLNTDTLALEKRDFNNVGNKKVNAYQYDHPELKPYIQQEANILKGEFERNIKPEKGSNMIDGERVGYGNKSMRTQDMATILDNTGASYEKVQKGLDNIIEDHGKENNALSKKIELVINSRLETGYSDDVYGITIPPNRDYISGKNDINSLPGELNMSKVKTNKLNNFLNPIEKPLEPIKPLMDNKLPLPIETPKNNLGTQFDNPIPVNNIEPPLQKVRKFSDSVMNDPNTPQPLAQNLKEEPYLYDPISNKETFDEAQKIMDSGFDKAVSSFNEINMAKEYNPKDVVLGEMLMRKAAENGNVAQSREIGAQLAEKLTQAGQFIQAASILRRSEPEGFIVFMQKQLNKLNKDGLKTHGKKWSDIVLSDEQIKSIETMRTMTDVEKQKFQESLYKNISQQIPSTGMEKFNAWRRMSMLFNPLTHIKNLGGNSLFMPLRKGADMVASVMEKALPIEQRTKSIGWSRDANLKSLVEEDWNLHGKDLTSGNTRWDIGTVIGNEKRIFKNNVLESINKFSGKSLEAEDIPFMKNAYNDALGGYLKAQGLTKVTQNARDYASRRALEATYKDLNRFSKMIIAIKRNTGIFGEAGLPFAKTPSNLTVRAFENSPYGLVTELAKASHQIRKGTFEPVKFIEQISKGITGTIGLTTLGFGLADAGIITSSPPTDKDQAAYNKEHGVIPYSLKIGGKYFSYDWAMPLSTPLAMGAEIYNKNKDKSGFIDTAYSSVIAGGDTIFNSSMLRSVKAMFGGSYSSPTEAIAGTLMNYPKQAVPSLGGQLARVIDTKERDITGNGVMDTLVNYGKSRMPILSKTLPVKIKTNGQPSTTGNLPTRIANNMLLPFKLNNAESNDVDKLIQNAYNDTGNKSVFPKVAPKKFSDDKISYTLTPQEKNDFQAIMGKESYNGITRLKADSNSHGEQKTISELRAKAIEKIISDAYDEAKKDLINKRKEKE